MARIALVQSGHSGVPAALALLSHTVRTLTADEARSALLDDDLLVVDARDDLVAARDLCRTLRDHAVPQPVLLVVDASALAVVSADWQVDDFVLEGCSPAEMEARLRLALAAGDRGDLIEAGPLVVDEKAYSASVGGAPLELTYTEFELLKFLAMHPGRVLTRETLLSEVWGYDYYGGTRTVDVHIRRLRAKLGTEYEQHITTVRNVGYCFSPNR